jgi:hypothetical protein
VDNVKEVANNTLHNPVEVTKHAIERVNERFGISKQQATNWVRQRMNSAEFVAITDNEGTAARMFAYAGAIFVLDIEVDRVISVYKPYKQPLLYDKVKSLVLRELKRVERIESKTERRNTLSKAELEVELAECKLMLLRSRSHSRRNVLQARINAIQIRINELDTEIIEVRTNKKHIARGVASYI